MKDEHAETNERTGLLASLKELWSTQRAPLIILVTVPLALTFLEYWGMPWHYTRYNERVVTYRPPARQYRVVDPAKNPPLADLIQHVNVPGPDRVKPYLWWSAACLLCMVVLPIGAGLLAGARPRSLGLKIKGTGREALTYLGLYALFFPVLWVVSGRAEFQETYPFFEPKGGALDQEFLIFQAAYCLQFFAVEFFFRGFMVLGLKPYLGWASVLVMLAPYCMIHYYKPMPEALGAVGAGIVLGALAFRSGTIIYGWFLHYGVALTMDMLSLYRTDRLAG